MSVKYKRRTDVHVNRVSYISDVCDFVNETNKARMVNHCFIDKCKSDSRNDSSIRFFRIPAIVSERNRKYIGFGQEKQQEKAIELSKKRHLAWIVALKKGPLDSVMIKNVRICQKHFLLGEPAHQDDETHPDWVPHINLGVAVKRKSTLERYERHSKRMKLIAANVIPSVDIVDDEPGIGDVRDLECDEMQIIDTQNNSIGTQTDLTMENLASLMEELSITKEANESLAQKLFKLDISPESFEHDNEKTKYFTGLTDYRILLLVHDTIASSLYSRGNATLSTFQQLLLTLMKLRLNLPFKFLSYRFGVASFTVSRYFRRCLHVLYSTFISLVPWPDRETLHSTMPACFRQCFGTLTTTIIDCFEIFMERPSNLYSSAQCWSHYKHHKTVKHLLACSPQGSIMFVSNSYGGRASDDYITQDSGFLDHITPGDLVLADRGFKIDEVLSLMGSTMNTPAFTRRKNQLHPVELEETRHIANVRIHIERIIGALKQIFTILSGTVPISLLCTQKNGISVFDEIIGVCAILLNLRPSVIHPD